MKSKKFGLLEILSMELSITFSIIFLVLDINLFMSIYFMIIGMILLGYDIKYMNNSLFIDNILNHIIPFIIIFISLLMFM